MKFIRNTAEKVFGTFTEGPDPPNRIEKMVLDFANMHPHATRGDWVGFATEIARESYRAGYVRGFEYVERDEDSARPDIPPEVYADLMDPDWRWGDAVQLHHDPDAPVQFSFPDEDVTRHQLSELKAHVHVEDPMLKGARRR